MALGRSTSGTTAVHPLDKQLDFYKEYLIQTRREIDLEKTEGTRILHLKIILLGGLLAFIATTHGFWIAIPFPFLLFALDYMQTSRLQYILDRWQFLEEAVIPKLRQALGDPAARFFEEDVLARHRRRVYWALESLVRTLLILPMIGGSAIALGAVLSKYTSCTSSTAYWATIAYLVALTGLCMIKSEVYRRYLTCLFGIAVSAFFIADLLLIEPFNLIEMINAVLG